MSTLSLFNAPACPVDAQSCLNILVNAINTLGGGGTQSVQTQLIGGFGAGTQTATSGTVGFSNSNGISFGMSGSSQITASYTVPSQGISTGGNTSGTSGAVNGQMVFVGGNNITLSQSVNGQSATLSISAPNAVAQTNQTVGFYGVSNTTQNSSTTLDARTLSFQGAGGVSVGASNGSIVISGAGGAGVTLSRSMNFYPYMAMTAVSFSNGQENIVYFPCAANLSASRVDILVNIGGNLGAATTGSLSITQLMGIYTNNAGTLSSLSTASASTTFSAANNTYFKFDRNISMPININMTPGDYFIMNNLSVSFVTTSAGGSATANTNFSIYINPSLNNLGQGGGDMFVPIGVTTNASVGIMSGAGVYSVTSGAIPATINLTGVNISQTNYPVCLQFRNI